MKKSSILMRKMLVLALAAMPLASYAQNLQEGWYQIKRSMSATELEKQLKDVSWENVGKFFQNAIRQEYLYVGDEIQADKDLEILGINTGAKLGKRVYGAKYIESNTEHIINTGDVNTYFYVTPVEGETEAYTIRSYNGHYLHSDGTFCVEPETLYLGKAFDLKAENTKSGLAGIASGIFVTGFNLTVSALNISGYSVGKASKTFELDPKTLSGGTVDPGFKLSTSYKEMSWQQSITEETHSKTDAEGNVTTTTEVVYGEYMDGKNTNVGNLATTVAKDLLSGELNFSDQMSIIRFVMRNFVSDAYTFHKVDLTSVSSGGDGILGSIGGAVSRRELIPYTVQIEGWGRKNALLDKSDYRVEDARDYLANDPTKLTQVTHTNASVIITSNATHKEFDSAPIYNGGTIFGLKNNGFLGFGKGESSFIDTGDHGCSNVVITPRDYNNGFLGLGANGVQDFSDCISAACVDEVNHIIHVYFTKPGLSWDVKTSDNGRYVTRCAPFALNVAKSQDEMYYNSTFPYVHTRTHAPKAYYATSVGADEVVELVELEGSVIPAHTAMLIKDSEGASRTFEYTVADDQSLEAPAGNLLHGVCFAYDLDADVNAYVLKTIDGKQKFYKLNQDDRKLASWRAYLEYNGAAGSALRIADFEEDVEGIDTVLAPETSNSPIYDLSGRRVNSSNGVTISAGKKYINK